MHCMRIAKYKHAEFSLNNNLNFSVCEACKCMSVCSFYTTQKITVIKWNPCL